MPRLSWPGNAQKNVYVPGARCATTVSDSPLRRSFEPARILPEASRRLKLCGVGPSLWTLNATLPGTVVTDGSISKSFSSTSTAVELAAADAGAVEADA